MSKVNAVSMDPKILDKESWSPVDSSSEPPALDAETADHPLHDLKERVAAGRKRREKAPRSAHGEWKPDPNRPDPIELLVASNQGRLPELIPIRYGRMMKSPFAFLRGAAAVMAHDLAQTPTTGLRVQACGDCHLMNFGAFASPERTLLFDINDFDETLPGPWEWDLKRLAASVVVAARYRGASKSEAADAAMACSRSYRRRIREYASMNTLDVWYSRIAFGDLIQLSRSAAERKLWEQGAANARARTAVHVIPKLIATVREQRRIVDNPPCIYHPPDGSGFDEEMRTLLRRYRETLSADRRFLFDRFHFVDAAVKVVGVGSVGTRCAVAFFEAGPDDPLVLQIKEARRSVLESSHSKSHYSNQGERVVVGQRLMQSASDIFLGWARDPARGFDFYVRQLRDMKGSVSLEAMGPADLADYAEYCAWALARAHAKSGDAVGIAGYLGKKDSFDKALAAFAAAYADQTERDHAALVKAIKTGRIKAEIEEEKE